MVTNSSRSPSSFGPANAGQTFARFVRRNRCGLAYTARSSPVNAVTKSPSRCLAAQAVQFATVSLRRAASPAGAGEERLLSSFSRRAVVDQTLGSLGSSHPLIDDPYDFEDPDPAVEVSFHPVPHPHLGSGLRGGVVDVHVAGAAGLGGRRAGLAQPDGTQPLIYPD